MSEIILREFNGTPIRQREDGYFNLTDMAKSTGKLYADWYRLNSTQELMSVITQNMGIPMSLLIHTVKGTKHGGTYGHKKIAIAFATWCSPEFFSLVIDWADNIITKGGYIMPSATSEQLEALQGEVARLQKDKNLISSNFVHMLRKACYAAAKNYNPTYEEIFRVLQNTLTTNGFGQVHFTADRIKYILAQWKGRDSQFNRYGSLSCFETDFIPFLKCVADNYRVPGIGGTGEQKALRRLIEGF
jgi:hypothetical protein